MATWKSSWRYWLCGLLVTMVTWGTLVAPFLAKPAWAQSASYVDMAGHLGEPEVNDLVARGILDPSANPSFQPDSPFLRGDFLALLAKASGIVPAQPAKATFYDLPLVAPDSAPIEGMLVA
ncbi:MAG: S-layer homology domain-containing protein, partial [Chloroflexi bacterium]|nr:S-layer homology domain-containing protein [Chloroflexota bacterium]